MGCWFKPLILRLGALRPTPTAWLHCAANRIACGMSKGQLGKRENWRQTSRPSITIHTDMPNERCSW